MENNNSPKTEKLDDDILQCRNDILRNRKKNQQTTEINTDTAKQSPAENLPADPAKPVVSGPSTSHDDKVRIPRYEELVDSTQVVDAKWENKKSEKLEPLIIPEPKTSDNSISVDDTISIEQAPPVAIPQPAIQEERLQDDTDAGKIQDGEKEIDLTEESIITPEEEDALLSFDDAGYGQETDSKTEERLEILKQQVADAKANAQAEIEELEGIEELIDIDGIEKIADEKTEEAKTEEIKTNQQPFARVKEKVDSIPSFDIAEKILAQQRKVASNRRQRPLIKRNLSDVMPIAGTVGQIIEQAKRAANIKNEIIETADEKTFDEPVNEVSETTETIVIERDEQRSDIFELSVAASGIIKDSGTLDPYQKDIISGIVSRDIAVFCGEPV